MTLSRADLARLVLVSATLLLCWSGNLAADWQEYQARYSVYRNGKLTGKADFTLEKRASKWIVKSVGSGTHGLARILKASDTEMAEGRLIDGRFRPDRFVHHARVAGIDDRWQALFNWERGIVQVVQDRSTLEMDLGAGALDGLSLKLELQRRLRAGDENMQFYLVDDDEIKHQVFRVLESERLETSLGCLETVPVERVRTNSTRYTRAWHAPALDFVTVRMEHGKTDGDHMEVRISGLVLSGKEIAAVPGCSARQTGG